MAISDVSSKNFANDLMRLSLSIVWKDMGKAVAAESDENRMEAEAYIAARRGELNFKSVQNFHPQILEAFFPSPDEYIEVVGDKKMIPENLRPAIIAAEQRYLIEHWEQEDGEQNSYYRMLFGFPPIDMPEEKMAYNTKYSDYATDIPIHLLPYSDLLRLEKMGYLEELRKSKKDGSWDYLKHCGRLKIYPYIARQAEPFEMLHCDECQVKQLKNDFVDTFEAARRMMVRVYYTDAYRNQTKLYDGFLALCILFMTQQRMCSKYIETNITRDFYDLDSLRVLYDAYGVPFFAEIPLTYHTKIVKRLNELLSYKGSTQVFYDLFNIFDFGTMDVFEYFLVKRRLIDINGNPVFRDHLGRPLKEEDMWKIRFAKVAYRDEKFVEISNPENIVDYEDLTVPDPYWVEDKQLQDKLYKTDWNYFHSKYLGVQIMFDLTKLIFESCYFLRMLEDNRGTTSEITTYYMVTGTDEPLFDLVIYAVALLCKNAGYTGEIPTDPSSIAAVYGFNFAEYREILATAQCSTHDFVINLKAEAHAFIDQNEVLRNDAALIYWVDQVTEGAFGYLGDDFPYGEPHLAPPPLFLHDFIPTNNSIVNLKEYLAQNIKILNGASDEMIDAELNALYQRLQFSEDDLLEVKHPSSAGYNSVYHAFYLARQNWTAEDKEKIHKAILASYEQLLALITRRIKVREAVIFDPHILEIIQDLSIIDEADVDTVYKTIKELDTYLTYMMQNTHDKIAYNAYYNTRKILMTTQLMNETFEKKNGTVAKTYADLLAEINPKLYQRLIAEETDCDMEEQYVIQTLMNLCDELTLLQAINTDNIQRIINYLMKLLMFLKSAKVDLVDFEIIYMISDRNANYIKLISQLWAQDIEDGHLKDFIWLIDAIHLVRIWQVIEDRFWLIDPNLGCRIRQVLKDKFEFLTDNGRNNLIMEVEQILHDEFQYWLAELTGVMIRHQINENLVPVEHWAQDVKQRLPSGQFELTTDLRDPPYQEDDWEIRDKFLLEFFNDGYAEVIDSFNQYFRMKAGLAVTAEGEIVDMFALAKDGINPIPEMEFYIKDYLLRSELKDYIDIVARDDQFIYFRLRDETLVEKLYRDDIHYAFNYREMQIERQLREQLFRELEGHYFEASAAVLDFVSIRDKGVRNPNVEFEPASDAVAWNERIHRIIEEPGPEDGGPPSP